MTGYGIETGQLAADPAGSTDNEYFLHADGEVG
jgi:hypothetical protein